MNLIAIIAISARLSQTCIHLVYAKSMQLYNVSLICITLSVHYTVNRAV